MLIFHVEHLPTVIPVGVQTADNVCRIGFDVSSWLDKWPDMQLSVWHTLPGDIAAYEAQSVREGNILYWIVRAVDTAKAGSGWVEVLGMTADRRCPSGKAATQIAESSLSATKEPPEAFADWYARLMEKIAQVDNIPQTDAAHQQLVTDAVGVTVWEDRTHYDNREEITWDGDTTDKVVSEVQTYPAAGVETMACYYKVSDLTPNISELKGKVIKYSTSSSSAVRSGILRDSQYEEFDGGWGVGITTPDLRFVVITKPGATHTGKQRWKYTFPETGLYIGVTKTAGSYWDYIAWGSLLQLDDKYIPSTIARAEDMKAADDAQTAALNAAIADRPVTDVPHQQLITDGAGAATWAPRLAYAYQGTVEVLAPTALSYLGEESGMQVHLLMAPLAAELEQGKTYKVSYNGASYECPVVYVPAGEGENNDGYALGNTASLGLEGSNADAPFVCMRSASYEENGYYAMCVALDGAVSVTLSITGEEEKIHKLPHAYYDQPDMDAMWNQEGYVKGREYWSVELPGGEMVFDPAQLESYEAYTVGDGMTAYKISDIPMTKDTLDGAFGNAGVTAGDSADDIYGLVVNATVIQEKAFLWASVNPVKNGVEKLYGYLVAIYDEGVSPIIGDITFGGLTPGTYVMPETDPPPYVRVAASVVGKQLDRKYGALPKGKTTSPYLKWSEGQGWTTITLEQLKNDLGMT